MYRNLREFMNGISIRDEYMSIISWLPISGIIPPIVPQIYFPPNDDSEDLDNRKE